MRLDVVVEIHRVVISLGALERKDVGIFAVDFDTRGGDVNGLGTEGTDGSDGHNCQHEGKDKPLVLAKNEKVIVEMRLVRRKLPSGQA